MNILIKKWMGYNILNYAMAKTDRLLATPNRAIDTLN